MIRYSIADLENLTGIKAHTIRIWEKRYNLVNPHRTDTNIRYYDNDQMKKLINVGTLLRGGYKISKISKFSEIEMNEKIDDLLTRPVTSEDIIYEVYIGQLITAGLAFDEVAFDQTISNGIRRFGIQVSYVKILIPLLSRVGMFWSTNHMNPAQEHFITNLVEQKLHAAIDALPPAVEGEHSALLFLPQNESHEIGLLMAKYILRNAGMRVTYLGARVPFENLKSTVIQCKPTHMVFFFIQIHPFEQMQAYLDLMAEEFTDQQIFVSGFPYILDNLEIPSNITWITDPGNFEKIIE
jgi:DNA-binding transcriptional MerR regulator